MESEVSVDKTKAFKVTVLTPKGKIWEGHCSKVSVPSIQQIDSVEGGEDLKTEGQIELLPKHVAYEGLLGAGILSCKSLSTSEVIRIAVFDGFLVFERSAEIDELKVLADDAYTPDIVDSNGYAKDREELKSILADTESDTFKKSQARKEIRKIEIIDSLISH